MPLIRPVLKWRRRRSAEAEVSRGSVVLARGRSLRRLWTWVHRGLPASGKRFFSAPLPSLSTPLIWHAPPNCYFLNLTYRYLQVIMKRYKSALCSPVTVISLRVYVFNWLCAGGIPRVFGTVQLRAFEKIYPWEYISRSICLCAVWLDSLTIDGGS